MLRLYGADNEEITYNQPTQLCGNPACLGEPWCSAWGICKDVAVYDDTAGVDTSESSLTHGRKSTTFSYKLAKHLSPAPPSTINGHAQWLCTSPPQGSQCPRRMKRCLLKGCSKEDSRWHCLLQGYGVIYAFRSYSQYIASQHPGKGETAYTHRLAP